MTPGPVLLVHEFNPANKLHALLSQLNVMTIWYAAVLAVGLSKVSGASFRKAALWTFGLWAILVALIVVPRWGR
jgi:VIT1/CCC1 family predicted Fe2+/Mn2+ transporter